MDIENTLVCNSPEIERGCTLSEGERQLSAKIQQLIKSNKLTISSLLILIPSMAIPAYHDWRHPLISISLGILAEIGIVVSSAEQFIKKDGRL